MTSELLEKANCADCLWAQQIESKVVEKQLKRLWLCRRYPPVTRSAMRINVLTRQPEVGTATFLPEVTEQDYCGEYKSVRAIEKAIEDKS